MMVYTGTDEFVVELQKRQFKSAEGILVPVKHGGEVTVESLTRTGFCKPIFLERKEGLNLRVPGIDFTVRDVALLVDPDRVVDVIDVEQQEGVNMTLREFVEHFYAMKRDTVYNIISLEFSRTRLSTHVAPPEVVRRLSLIRRHWIRPDDNDGEDHAKPHVQKYCLISMSNSYTDFHIDFGGSSVWYHILWGEKIFYLIEPTPENLKVYKRWMRSEANRSTFLPSLLAEGSCHELHIRTGNTLFIPSGWIHAVFTPEDSLVFGGNFLHEINIPMQLRIYAIEKSLATSDKFMFPYFEELHWFVAFNLVRQLKEERMMKSPPRYLVRGLAALATHLKRWYELKVTRAKQRVFSQPAVEDDDDLPPWFDRSKVLGDLLKLVPTLSAADDSSERSWTSSADGKKGARRPRLNPDLAGGLRRMKEEDEEEEEEGKMTAHGCGGMRIRITKKKRKRRRTPERTLLSTAPLPSINEELRIINRGQEKKESLLRSEEAEEEARQLFGEAKESGDFLYYDSSIDPVDRPKRKKKKSASRPSKVEVKEEDADFAASIESKKGGLTSPSSTPSTSQGQPTSPSALQGRFGRRKGEATVKQRLGKKLGLSKLFR